MSSRWLSGIIPLGAAALIGGCGAPGLTPDSPVITLNPAAPAAPQPPVAGAPAIAPPSPVTAPVADPAPSDPAAWRVPGRRPTPRPSRRPGGWPTPIPQPSQTPVGFPTPWPVLPPTPAPTAPPPTPVPSAPPPTAPPAATPTPGGSNPLLVPNPQNADLAAMEAYIFQQTNVERAKVGAPALVSDSTLNQLARERSQDMVNRNYFSHQTPDGLYVFDMLKTLGISYSTAGENIAMNTYPGQQAGVEAMTGWMNSPGHKANILSAQFGRIGVGAWKKSDGSVYFTQDFTN